MHAKLMAALVVGGCLLGVQTSALAQAVSAYPQSWTGADPATGTGPRQTGYFDQFSRNGNRYQPSAHCAGNYDPNNGTCYSAGIHTPSHE
jgi:hypothetical protein